MDLSVVAIFIVLKKVQKENKRKKIPHFRSRKSFNTTYNKPF